MTTGKDLPAGVRSRLLAAEILERVEKGAWAGRLLAARAGDLPDSRDRALLSRLVLDTLRWQGALDHCLAPFLKHPLERLAPRARALLRLGLCQARVLELPAAVAVSTAVDAARSGGAARAAGLVNAVLRRCCRSREAALDPRLCFPPWLLERWRRRWGAERVDALCAALNRPARPFVVPLKSAGGAAALAESLAEDGVDTVFSSLVPGGLEVGAGAPQLSTACRRGACVILDPSAALVARLAAAAPPGPTADLAAAPGGKASLLIDQRAGPLIALEPVASRLRNLAANLARRFPPEPYAVVRADALAPPLAEGSFALLLLDAPCSGTGTLRRHPDRRWRLSEGAIRRAAELQARLLDAAARLAAPGGVLLYAVCSIEAEEGVERIRAFLDRHPDFEALDPRPWLPEEARSLARRDPPRLEILPLDEGDGFQAALLRRR
ncbi:MAG: transcription antitermination factor NusB [Acidobacteriota bacterium]|nr:transcription antitermination factor NusB [Acidobacteriota bacterium]MDQ7088078.1 transcription antitermination factor NusB [Acidobacteriota bacterium]